MLHPLTWTRAPFHSHLRLLLRHVIPSIVQPHPHHRPLIIHCPMLRIMKTDSLCRLLCHGDHSISCAPSFFGNFAEACSNYSKQRATEIQNSVSAGRLVPTKLACRPATHHRDKDDVIVQHCPEICICKCIYQGHNLFMYHFPGDGRSWEKKLSWSTHPQHSSIASHNRTSSSTTRAKGSTLV